jgi:ribosomal-protein-alanine N-acetyltransferase
LSSGANSEIEKHIAVFIMNRTKIFSKFPELETERLILRELDIESDAPILFESLFNVPDIIKFDRNRIYEIGEGLFSILPSMKQKMHSWMQGFWNKKIIVWGIELKSSNKLIGTRSCFFHGKDIINMECKLNKDYWRNGYMFEATLAIIQFLEYHDVMQIINTINVNNTAAINLDVKLGFQRTKLNELFSSDDIYYGDMGDMNDPNELIFVKPKINSTAIDYYSKANDAFSNKNFRLSENYCVKALEIQQDFIHALNKLAWCKLEMQDPINAVHLFSKVLEQKPNKYSALLGSAYAHSDLQNIDSAIKDFEKYLELETDDDETFVMLGNLYYQNHEYRESIIAYENALRINPNHIYASQNIIIAQQKIS